MTLPGGEHTWLELLLANLVDYAIFHIDLDGTIQTWHPAVERLLGYSEAEFVGLPVARLFTPDDQKAGVPADAMSKAERGEHANDDRWHVRRDGSLVFVFGSVTALRDDAGKVRGFGKVLRDRTEHVELMNRLRATKAAAEQANQEKDAFVAVLAHEVRQPLNVMQGWLEMLGGARDRPDLVERAMPGLRRSVQFMTRLVDDLLDASRAATGALALDLREMDLHALVAEAVAEAGETARAKRIEILTDHEPVRARVDPMRVTQVVNNLLSNALKFTAENGWVRITVRAAGPSAQIIVADSGTGIPPERLPDIFERYSQLERRGDQHGFRGFGLGLWLVREIVSAHGGTVTVESEGRGRGSRFTVALPRPA